MIGVDRFTKYEEKPNLREAIRVTLENFQYVQSILGAIHTEIMSSSEETTFNFRFEDKDRKQISILEYDFLVRHHKEGQTWRPTDYTYSVEPSAEFLNANTPVVRQLDAQELVEVREMLRNLRRLARE